MYVGHIFTLSKTSSVLAAQVMNFSECHMLDSFGETAILSRCTEVQVDFGGKNSGCGIQPSFKNWTISHDGKTLKAFTNCYWKNNLANFEGLVYQFYNNNWTRLNPLYNAVSIQNRAQFKVEIDRSEPYLSSPLNPDQTNMFQLLGELNGLLEENNVNTMNDYVQLTKESAVTFDLSSGFSKLRTWALGALVLVAGIVTVLIGFLSARRLYSWFSKRTGPNPVTANSDPPCPPSQQAIWTRTATDTDTEAVRFERNRSTTDSTPLTAVKSMIINETLLNSPGIQHRPTFKNEETSTDATVTGK